MPLFSTLRDVSRLTAELSTANDKIASLEAKLEKEREDRLSDNHRWADRFLHKQGVFGLAPIVEKASTKPETPKLTEMEQLKLDAYRQAAFESGLGDQAGVQAFFDERAGKPLPYQMRDYEEPVDMDITPSY